MDKKMAFVLIALIGIGLYALPQTMALFAGQHEFVNIDATGNQIACVKCHGDIQAEMSAIGVNPITGTGSPHSLFKCEYCHRIEPGAASGDNAYAIVTYKNGTSMRTLAITMKDFEEENFPGSNKYSGEGIINDVLDKAAAQSGGVRPTEPYALSPIVTGTESNTAVLPLSSEYVKPTVNATGHPYDTSARRFDGLKLSAIPQDATGWTVSSRYWTPTLLNAGSKAVNPGTEYHAASLVSCLECHGGFEPLGHYSRVLDGEVITASSEETCRPCHYGYTNKWTELAAGGFGITGGIDTGAKEAHMPFQTTDDGMSVYKTIGTAGYSNGACIACHTHVSVDITYTRPDTMKWDAVTQDNGSTVVGGFAATGSVVTTSPTTP